MADEIFGRFRLDELIGQGAMGEVYAAFDTVKQRTVAVKRLRREIAADAAFQERFRRESALAARIGAPHVIPIYDYGQIDGQLFIEMQLVKGPDLAAQLSEIGPLPAAEAVRVVAQIAEALAAAHADGLVHRDVKPSNVLLSGPGRDFAYLVDFGIARSLEGGGLTATGESIGTIAYMAPERFLGDAADHRVDVYSLACVLYESLTGRKPFGAQALPAMIHAHLNFAPPVPSDRRPDIPPALDDVVVRGMAKDPQSRYQSARELAKAATEALDAPTVRTSSPFAGTLSESTEIVRTEPPSSSITPIPAGSPGAVGWDGTPWRGTETTNHAVAVSHPPTAAPSAPAARRSRILVLTAAGLAVVVAATVGTVALTRGPSSVPAAAAAPTSPATSTSTAAATTPTVRATVNVGSNPGAVRVSPDGATVYLTTDAGLLTVDPQTNATSTIPLAQSGAGSGLYRVVTLSRDGTSAYANTLSADGTMEVITTIDTASKAVIGIAPVGVSETEYVGYIEVSPDGTSLYVTTFAYSSSLSTLLVVGTDTGAVASPVQIGTSTVAFLAPDGTRAYLLRFESGEIAELRIGQNTAGPNIAVGVEPSDLKFAPDGSRAYLAVAGGIAVIDTTTNTVSKTIPVTGPRPLGLAVSNDGAKIYFTTTAGVSEVDTTTGTVTPTVPLAFGNTPGSIALAPDGRRAYVTNPAGATLTIIDLPAP